MAVEPAMWKLAEDVLHLVTVLSAMGNGRMFSHRVSLRESSEKELQHEGAVKWAAALRPPPDFD